MSSAEWSARIRGVATIAWLLSFILDLRKIKLTMLVVLYIFLYKHERNFVLKNKKLRTTRSFGL